MASLSHGSALHGRLGGRRLFESESETTIYHLTDGREGSGDRRFLGFCLDPDTRMRAWQSVVVVLSPPSAAPLSKPGKRSWQM